MSSPSEDLSAALGRAAELDSRRAYAEAANALDAALTEHRDAPASLRFQALLLRADVAVSLNELGEGRGILAEAKQVRLSGEERAALATELRRADDLESFFTHRGCAG